MKEYKYKVKMILMVRSLAELESIRYILENDLNTKIIAVSAVMKGEKEVE